MRVKKTYMWFFLLCALTGLLLGGCTSSDTAPLNVINLNTVNGVASSPIFSDPTTTATDAKGVVSLVTPCSTDIMWVDPIGGYNRIYATDRGAKNAADLNTLTGRVWVIDGQSDSVLFAITGFFGKHPAAAAGWNQSGPNGVMVANSASGAKELWAGDGDSKVRWVNLNVAGTPTIGGAISTGGLGRADELAYDPDDDLVLVGNDSEPLPFLSFINRNTKAVTGKIMLDGKDAKGGALEATFGVEQPMYDKPFFYVAIPATKWLVPPTTTTAGTYDPKSGAVIQIDPKTMSVTKTWLVGTTAYPICEPHGLALGPNHNVMIACGSKTDMVVKIINDQTGAIVADVPQVGATDMAWFNVTNMSWYVGAGSYKVNPATDLQVSPVIGVIDALTNKWVRNIPVGSIKDGKSVVVNPQTNRAYTFVSDVGPGGIRVLQ